MGYGFDLGLEKERLRCASLDLGRERGAEVGSGLKQIGDEPDLFALTSDVFGPCGGDGRSDLVVEDRPWRATPRSVLAVLLLLDL